MTCFTRQRSTYLAVVILLAVSMTVLAPARAADGWRPRTRAAIEYAESRAGSISFAVVGMKGALYGYRAKTVVPSASVLKVMLMATYLRQSSVRNRKLNDDDRSLLGPMIKWSDNAAAGEVIRRVGGRRIYRLAEDAGMHRFVLRSQWGLSSITAREQAQFMFRFARYIPQRHEHYARYLLSHIVPKQRWGIARLRLHDWRLFFKGGWGSGTGWVTHQVAFLRKSGRRVAIAILIRDSPNHDYGTETLRGIAARVFRDLPW